jgi:hypothetical protein
VHVTQQRPDLDVDALADEIDDRVRALPVPSTEAVRRVRRDYSSRGGTGDAGRTLDLCGRLVDDRDDMVVKALSWALRALAPWDPAAVGDFLEANDARLAARVRREVRTKLATGRKHPPVAGNPLSAGRPGR